MACRRARAVWDRRGAAEEQSVAGHGAAVVVEDDGQPGLFGLPTPVFQPDVQFRMIGLPDGVGTSGLVAMDQIDCVGIGLRPFVGQGHQGWVERADHGIDGAVTRWGFPEPLGKGDDLAMNGRRGQNRFLQSKSFNDLTEAVGELSLASVVSLLASKSGEPLTALPILDCEQNGDNSQSAIGILFRPQVGP
jgi:hypothetical protein